MVRVVISITPLTLLGQLAGAPLFDAVLSHHDTAPVAAIDAVGIGDETGLTPGLEAIRHVAPCPGRRGKGDKQGKESEEHDGGPAMSEELDHGSFP